MGRPVTVGTNHLALTQSPIGLVLASFPMGAQLSYSIVTTISMRVWSGRTTMAFGLLRVAAVRFSAWPQRTPPKRRLAMEQSVPPSMLWVLLNFAFISELTDEGISEWVSIYLDDDLETGPALISRSYAIFAMTCTLQTRIASVTLGWYWRGTRHVD